MLDNKSLPVSRSGCDVGSALSVGEAGALASEGAMGKLEGVAWAGGISRVNGLASAGAIGTVCSSLPCSKSPTYCVCSTDTLGQWPHAAET